MDHVSPALSSFRVEMVGLFVNISVNRYDFFIIYLINRYRFLCATWLVPGACVSRKDPSVWGENTARCAVLSRLSS